MRPGIEGLPADYDPRYPRELDPAEYEERIAPDQRQRIVAAAAAAASLALAPKAAVQGEGGNGPERVEAVLRVLTSGAAGRSGWFSRSTFELGKDAQGNPTVLPSIPIMFGNSMSGLFDANRARELARDLFVAYGLAPVVGHRFDEREVQASIDVYDSERKVGVELHGAMPERNGMEAQPTPEPAASALDGEEHARLAARGARVQGVDLHHFPVMDGDGATSTIAYLAGIVDFLNEVAGGPEVDLTAILSKQQARIALPKPPLEADNLDSVTYSIDPKRGYEHAILPERRWGEPLWREAELARPGSTPLLLEIHARPQVALTVEQDGEHPLRIEAPGTLVFLPPRFDPSRPFRVTVHLQPGPSWRAYGSYDLEPYLVLYGLPR